MKQKRLVVSGLNRNIFRSTFIFLSLLTFFIYLKFTNDNIVFDIIMYALIILSLFWGIGLDAIIKTRIIIDQDKLRAPFFVWHEDFRFDMDTEITIKPISLDQILFVSLVEISNKKNDIIGKAIQLKIKDSGDLCILLDKYSEKDVNRIFDYIQNHINKPIV